MSILIYLMALSLGHRERIFSPPPPPQAGGIPPVPPIPHRFLPLRRRPSLSFTPEPIIPNDSAFAFEPDIRPPRPEESTQPQNALAAAPSSHHTPAMGFGGALLAGVRHLLNPRGNSGIEQAHRRRPWRMSPIIMRWDPSDVFSLAEDESDMFFERGLDDAFGPGGVRLELEREFERRKQRRTAEPDYKPEYTHPSVSQPGFTHHFATNPTSMSTDSVVVLDDSLGPSSASSSRSSEPALACAQCHDHLILGASDVGEGRDQRRIWGLRCGHLLDGKCIRKLMQPVSTSANEQLPNSSVDTKGECRMDLASQDARPPSHENTTEESGADVSPIRSRLRSRGGISASPTGRQHPLTRGEPSTQPETCTPRRLRRNRRGKGKGKAKAMAPAITAEHQWGCPVNGCGHVHFSVLLDGRWIMDERRGAIAVFV